MLCGTSSSTRLHKACVFIFDRCHLDTHSRISPCTHNGWDVRKNQLSWVCTDKSLQNNRIRTWTSWIGDTICTRKKKRMIQCLSSAHSSSAGTFCIFTGETKIIISLNYCLVARSRSFEISWKFWEVALKNGDWWTDCVSHFHSSAIFKSLLFHFYQL